MNVNTSKGLYYKNNVLHGMNGNSVDIKLGHESKCGDSFCNADGELFYKTQKIATIRKASVFDKIKQFLAL